MACNELQTPAAAPVPSLTTSATAAVPLVVLMHRRNICRECPRATRNPDPQFAVNKGLTKTSECLEVKARHPKRANIAHGTERPELRCPLGKWPAFEPGRASS